MFSKYQSLSYIVLFCLFHQFLLLSQKMLQAILKKKHIGWNITADKKKTNGIQTIQATSWDGLGLLGYQK